LHDAGAGELLAVLDSATVTVADRSGRCPGTHVMARPDAPAIAVIGTGATEFDFFA
jgi:ornithine cyclodeaminase